MDITPPSVVDLPPPVDAAQNIRDAASFDLNADHFASLKPQLSPLIKQSQTTTDVTPTVAAYASKSTQHLALIHGNGPVIGPRQADADPLTQVDDPTKHSFMEKQMNFIGGQIKHGWEGDTRTTDQTLDKIFNPKDWTEDKELNLSISKMRDQQNVPSDYGLSPNAQLLGQGIGGVAGMFSDLVNNKEAAAAGGVAGAAIGFAAKGVPGALKGAFIGGFDAPFAYSTFKNTTASVYNNISDAKDPDGNSLNVDEGTKKNIALGVGAVNAAIQAGVGYAVARVVPGVSSVMTPKMVRAIMTDPAQAGLKKAFFNLGSTFATGTVGAAAQSALSTFAQAFAKSYDGSSNGLTNAVHAGSEELKNELPNIARSSISGGITAVGGGLAMTGISKGLGVAANTVAPTLMDRARQAAQVGAAVDQIDKVSKTTQMHEHSPDELGVLQRMQAENAGVKSVFVTPKDVLKWSESKAGIDAAKKWFSPTDTAKNTPIAMPMHNFLDLVRDFPQAKDAMRITADGPSVGESNEYIKNQDKNFPKLPEGSFENPVLYQGVRKGNVDNSAGRSGWWTTNLEKAKDYANKEGEGGKIRVTTARDLPEGAYSDDNGEPVSPKDFHAKTDEVGVADHLANKVKVHSEHPVSDFSKAPEFNEPIIIPEEVKTNKMDKVIDPTDLIQSKQDSNAELNNTYQNPNLHLTEQMKASQITIDPKMLGDEHKEFANDPQLKAHGVFADTGLRPEDAARVLGFDNVDTLLKTLKATPTNEQLRAGLAKQNAEVNKNAGSQPKLEDLEVSKKLEATAKEHLAEQARLKAIKTPTAKGEAPVKIGLPVPTYQDVVNDAKAEVADTKISDLDPTKHHVGAKISGDLAFDTEQNGEYFNAFQSHEAAARASEMARQSQIATGKVNQVVDLVTQFTPDVMTQLKDLDKGAHDAATEILGKFNLDPTKVDDVKEGSYRKYIENQTKAGGVVEPTPEQVSPSDNFGDMKVSEVLAVGDVLKNILKNTELKDAFMQPTKGSGDLSASEVITDIVAQLKAHPLRDESKLTQQFQPLIPKLHEQVANLYTSGEAWILQTQHIIADLDRGHADGLIAREVLDRVERSQFEKKKLTDETLKHNQKIFKQFGKERFENMGSNMITIPELANTKYGKLLESTLFAWELHWGNEGNLKVWDQYGISRELGRQVLDKYLTDDHTLLAQNMRGVFKSFYEPAQRLQLRSQGTEFVPVAGQGYMSRGKYVEGGYYPIHRIGDDLAPARKALVGIATVNKLDELRQNTFQGAQALTEQGHTLARVGGEGLLDTDLNRYGHSLNQLIHDLTMREAVRDSAMILAHPDVADGIKAIRGVEGYDNIKNWLVDVAGKVDREGYDRTKMNMDKFLNYMGSGFKIGAVALKATAAFKAPLALFQTIETMGNSGAKATYHMLATITKFSARPDLMTKSLEFAREIDPTIKSMTDQIVGKSANSLVEMMPDKGTWGPKQLSGPLKVAAWGKNIVVNTSMAAVSGVHSAVKSLAVLSAYHQAISGDVKGVKPGDYDAAVDYARGISRLTQYHSERDYISDFQKTQFAKGTGLGFFMADRNNATNNTILAARMAKANFAESGTAKAKSDYATASKAAAAGVGGMVNHAIFVMLARSMATGLVAGAGAYVGNAITSAVSGGDGSEIPEGEDDGPVKHLSKLLVDDVVGAVPVASEVYHGIAFAREGKSIDIKTPLTDVMKDGGNALIGVITGLGLAGEEEVTPEQAKAMLFTAGYLTHTPMSALFKYFDSPDLTDLDLPKVRISDLAKLGSAVTKYNDAKAEQKPSNDEKEFQDALKQYQQQVAPEVKAPTPPPAPVESPIKTPEKSARSSIPDTYYPLVSQVESGNDPSIKNPVSSAKGLYQVTQSTLNGIRNLAPQLDLPKRIADMTNEQQEQVVRVLTVQNARYLRTHELPVSEENLYLAHVIGLGHEGALAKILDPKNADMKLRNLMGVRELRDNSQAFGAVDKTEVNSMTVKEGLEGIHDWLDRGRDIIARRNQHLSKADKQLDNKPK